ncbi:hypothetical protein RSPO_m00302 (plasmid) [Ralstonia solanacearum Po82]|uniref:Uncharacterized protein n=1 Tax=Ralstonia solanacearum (strain Po82) TaxID=1031711 RepID=F6G8B2_RALS8|nr:hypothetical protein RSPO_m00302 [Ralstonia solanacearum Po82]
MIFQQDSLHGFLCLLCEAVRSATRTQRVAPQAHGMRPSKNPGVRLREVRAHRSRPMGARGAGPVDRGRRLSVEVLLPASGTDCRASAG